MSCRSKLASELELAEVKAGAELQLKARLMEAQQAELTRREVRETQYAEVAHACMTTFLALYCTVNVLIVQCPLFVTTFCFSIQHTAIPIWPSFDLAVLMCLQAVLSERESKLAAAEEAARAATAAARDRASAAQSAQQEVERAVAAQRQQVEQVPFG